MKTEDEVRALYEKVKARQHFGVVKRPLNRSRLLGLIASSMFFEWVLGLNDFSEELLKLLDAEIAMETEHANR